MSTTVQLSLTVAGANSTHGLCYHYLFADRIRAEEMDETIARLSKDVLRASGFTQPNSSLRVDVSFDMPQETVEALSAEIRREPIIVKN